MEREKLARLVDSLDHPDAVHQREVMDRLVALGPSVVEPLLANLRLVEVRVRKCLVQVLGEIGDERALLPLMRYVYDTGDAIEEGDARGLAMKAITRIAKPEQARKIFQFLMDVHEDPDPFVRGYVAQALGRFGDRRAIPILEDMLQDGSEFVRERAQASLNVLRTEQDTDSLDPDLSDAQLLQKIRGSRGGQREFFLQELMTRPNVFELAVRLVHEGHRGVLPGLQTLQKLGDARAREIAARHYQSTDVEAHRAICLRILAQHLAGDATPDEREIVRIALYSSDAFVRLAALEAAGNSGDDDLVFRALRHLTDRDPDVARAAARGLSRGLGPAQRRHLPDLEEAFDVINRRRVHTDAAFVPAEAYLLRAIKHVVADGGFGTAQAQEIAFAAIQNVRDERPVIITALELLEATTPPEGLDEDRRWNVADAAHLARLLEYPEDDVRARALELLSRGAPRGVESMLDSLSRLLYDRSSGLATRVIELIARVGTERAQRLLEDLEDEKDEAVRLAAQAALRRIRNSKSYIDAEFEPLD